MRLDEEVHVCGSGHADDWRDVGLIVEIEDGFVDVDFGDWIQRYSVSELRPGVVYYRDIWVAVGKGVTVKDFR